MGCRETEAILEYFKDIQTLKNQRNKSLDKKTKGLGER